MLLAVGQLIYRNALGGCRLSEHGDCRARCLPHNFERVKYSIISQPNTNLSRPVNVDTREIANSLSVVLQNQLGKFDRGDFGAELFCRFVLEIRSVYLCQEKI